MFGLIPFASRNALAPQGSLLNRLLDAFDEPFAGMDAPSFKVDVKDNGSAYELTAELPGMKREDITLSYDNSCLTIAAKSEQATDEKDEKGNYIRRERSYGEMSRTFCIAGIDESKATATFTDGVLKVELPKKEGTAEASHQIEITSGAA